MVGCLALFIGVSAFVQVERTVSGACLVEPSVRWTLTELRPGSFESKAVDLITGQTVHYRLYQFERPTFLELQLPRFDSEVDSRIKCNAGDPVASVRSSALDIDLAERTSALAQARALLVSLRSGAKPEELDQAEVARDQARADLEAYRPTYERHLRLHEEGIVSDQLWEEVSATYRLKELGVQLAEAGLRVLTAGARPEEIEAAEVTVAGLEEELEAVAAMASAQEVVSPVSGWLRLGGPDAAMVSVTGLDSMIVRIMVPQHRGHLPETGQLTRALVPGVIREPAVGRIARVDRRAVVTAAGPFVAVYGIVENADGNLEEGMQGRAKVYCGQTSLLELIWDEMTRGVRRELWPT